MQKDLKNFGLIWAVIFLVVGLLPLFKGSDSRNWAFIVALIFILISLFYPNLYQQSRFYPLWIKFGNYMGKINSKIIIFILFYLVFLPIGIILKLLRKDLLRKKLDKSLNSYFIDRTIQPNNMKNQF